jgi:hypothetical protein
VSPVKYELGFYIPEDDILRVKKILLKRIGAASGPTVPHPRPSYHSASRSLPGAGHEHEDPTFLEHLSVEKKHSRSSPELSSIRLYSGRRALTVRVSNVD